jgi:hypothetical protein
MTTRADLEREREALSSVRSGKTRVDPAYAALTASIARIDALLSLSDAMANEVADAISDLAEAEEEIGEHAYKPRIAAHRTVADLVRRTS